MIGKHSPREVDVLSTYINECMNITEEEVFHAADKLQRSKEIESTLMMYEETEALLSRRTRKYAHYH